MNSANIVKLEDLKNLIEHAKKLPLEFRGELYLMPCHHIQYMDWVAGQEVRSPGGMRSSLPFFNSLSEMRERDERGWSYLVQVFLRLRERSRRYCYDEPKWEGSL